MVFFSLGAFRVVFGVRPCSGKLYTVHKHDYKSIRHANLTGVQWGLLECVSSRLASGTSALNPEPQPEAQSPKTRSW